MATRIGRAKEEGEPDIMIRKIMPIAIALAIGTVTAAPRVATAASPTSSVTVSAVVPSSTTVTTTPATLASWTAANQTATFTVTVTTSDTNGYTFNFYDSSATGTTSYTLTGKTQSSKGTFEIGNGASNLYTNAANPVSTQPLFPQNIGAITLDCIFLTPPAVPDTYTDTVTVAVNLE